MSNLIPPLVSSTPPPIGSLDDDDDEFGDFTTAVECSYNCDISSIPSTPTDTPKKEPFQPVDINRNRSSVNEKDFQDKRKADDVNEDEIGMPNLENVPTHVVDDDDESDAVIAQNERNKLDERIDDRNVPSYISADPPPGDFYHEEPPEIDEEPPKIDEADDDFGDFEFSPAPIDDDEFEELDDSKSLESPPIENSVLPAFESSELTAIENSVLPALDSSEVTAIESSELTAIESSELTAIESSEITATESPELTAIKSSKIPEVPVESDKSCSPSIEEPECINDDFGNFADFRTAEQSSYVDEPKAVETTEGRTDDEFVATFAEEDFGDFDEYTSAAAPMSLNAENIRERTESIVERMFPTDTEDAADFRRYDFIVGDGIFGELKDITDTNALSYQWGKSRTQQSLLKSLNIDTRNILYGPGSSSMPKFAANLGLAPLEPVRSGALQPQPSQEQPTTPSAVGPTSSNGTTPSSTADIPVAQFDWNESGLANPLDSLQASSTLLLDLEQLVASLDKSSDTPATDERSDIAADDWNLWLQSNSKEEPPSPQPETDQPSIQKPTRTDYETNKTYDTESVNSLQFSDITVEPDDVERKPSDEDEDDFSDFASFQDGGKSAWPAGNMVPLRESHIASGAAEVKRSDGEEPGWLKPTILTPVLRRKDDVVHDDDDFSEFQTSVPSVLPAVEESKPVEFEFSGFPKEAEILQPSISNAPITMLKPVQSDTNASVQINWPDPGITEEELSRFEMYSAKTESPPERKLSGNTGLMLVEKSVVVPANKVVLPSKEVLLPPNDKVVISKDLVLPILESSPRKYTPIKSAKSEDDDWTEFISSSEPSAARKQSVDRTSTPELSLSIPQLSHIQPPKLPIPVITPKGLMQTKIPSSVSFAGNCQHKANPQTPLHIAPPSDGYQPSIISQQYAVQFNQNSFQGLYQTTSIPAYVNGASDDEWSDFVSSRPAANGLADWNARQPAARRAVPSISALPELDFAAPKTRKK